MKNNLLSQFHPFLNYFKTKHDALLSQLEKSAEVEDNRATYFSFYQHEIRPLLKLEVQTLFKEIAKKANITSGGPMCMLYYEQHQSSPSILRAESISGVKMTHPNQDNVAEEIKDFFKTNSPVCIPILDHIACDHLLSCANATLSLPPTEATLRHLNQLSYIHFEILKSNFEKKDNCLLPMSQQLLSVEEMNVLFKALPEHR